MKQLGRPITQRQLRVGEMIKQALGTLFIREEAKIGNFSTKEITDIVSQITHLPKKEIYKYCLKLKNEK